MVGSAVRTAALASVLAASASCSGPLSLDDRRAALADDLVAETDGRLDRDTAGCVADALFDELGDDAPAQVRQAERIADEEVRRQVIDAFGRCDAVGAALGTD